MNAGNILKVESNTGMRAVLLAVLVALAVAVSPRQAHADNFETAAAVMVGAALLFAAHEAADDDDHRERRVYTQAHYHSSAGSHHDRYRAGHHRHGRLPDRDDRGRHYGHERCHDKHSKWREAGNGHRWPRHRDGYDDRGHGRYMQAKAEGRYRY